MSYILLSSVFHQLGNAQPSTNETKQPEIRRGVVYDGTEDQTPAPSNRFLKSRLVQIEPELKGSPERLGSYVHFHKTNLINDTNLFVFDVKANITTDTQEVVLSGVAEFPENVKSLVTSLEILGFSNINNQIEMLPTEEFAATPIGVVVVPQSLVYNKPFEPRETMTDGILGDEFFPLKSYGDMILAHAPDGYVCYIERKALKLMSMEEFQ
ncbi:MAG: hypothetical protein SFY68_03990 [Candidatus Sumerlaeia bacterium]|nr:hypothetical protein [Candidatus Sumerlaeia bacterium]